MCAPVQLQDEERRRKQQLEEIRKREAEERAKQEEERRRREEERARRETEEKVHQAEWPETEALDTRESHAQQPLPSFISLTVVS